MSKLITGGELVPKNKLDKKKYPLYGKQVIAKLNDNIVGSLPFKKSKEVKKIRKKFYSQEEMDKRFDKNKDWEKIAKFRKSLKPEQLKRKKNIEDNPKKYLENTALVKDGRILQRGIQVYRHWFYFLKLGLELEEMNAEVCVGQSYLDKTKKSSKGSGETYVKDGHTYFKESTAKQGTIRMHTFFKPKVKRTAYKGWDLDQVLTDKFDNWWKGHNHLFQGYTPVKMSSPKEWSNKDNFIHIKVDTNQSLTKIREEFDNILSSKQSDFNNKWEIEGNPRVSNLQSYFNAVICKLKGMSAMDILDPNNRLLIKPDEEVYSKTRSKFTLSKDGHFKGYSVPEKKNKNGNVTGYQYSNTLSDFYNNGIQQLYNVCKGTFGKGLIKGDRFNWWV